MSVIAVVDDRKGPRDSVVRSLKSAMPEDWNCIASAPLESISRYVPWIAENKISALILDQRLNEQAQDSNTHVDYKGDDVVLEVRSRLPDFPVFVVSNYTQDEDLLAHGAEFESIVKRSDLTAEPNTHAQRIMRAANRFSEQRRHQLSQLTELSAKMAAGEGTPEDIRELRSIQATLGLAFMTDDIIGRVELLDKLEKKLDDLEKLAEELKPLIRGTDE